MGILLGEFTGVGPPKVFDMKVMKDVFQRRKLGPSLSLIVGRRYEKTQISATSVGVLEEESHHIRSVFCF